MAQDGEKDRGKGLVKFPQTAQDQPKITIYFGGSKKDLLQRYQDLAAKIGGKVSVAGLLTAAAEVCIDTLEKEAVSKRRFKLNGRDVIV